MSISLAFSAGKPCCNKKAGKNKAGKNTVSCKYNNVASDIDKDIVEQLTAEDLEGSSKVDKNNSAEDSKCAKSCGKKPWWKFWAKKSATSCPCKQAQAAQTASTE